MQRELIGRGLSAVLFFLLGISGSFSQQAEKKNVLFPARDVPIIAEVDTLVIGGTTGGVAAACAVRENGGEVFLVAPFPYLGEDMSATLRLWLEPGENLSDPLARAIYEDTGRENDFASFGKKSHPFTYRVLEKINPSHQELKTGPGRLCDGQWSDPVNHSLQIDGPATILVKMNKPQNVAEIDLVSYVRTDDFALGSVEWFTSRDGKTWESLGTTELQDGDFPKDFPASCALKLKKPISTQHLKIVAKPRPGLKRILLAELFVVPPEGEQNETDAGKSETEEPAFAPPRPLHVKKTLDDALLNANVKFLYSSFVTEILREKQSDRICGVLICNRQGEQAILCKTIVDASLESDLARMLAGKDVKIPAKNREFVVLGGEAQEPTGEFDFTFTSKIMGVFGGPWPNDAKTASGKHELIRYFLSGSGNVFLSKHAETEIQLATHHKDQQVYADYVWNPEFPDLRGAIAEKDAGNCVVLYDKDLRPVKLIAQGRKAGEKLARTAASLGKIRPENVVRGENSLDPISPDSTSGTILQMEGIVRFRGELKGTEKNFPHLHVQGKLVQSRDQYDVIVVGGGVSGAPAAIAAARAGAKVLLLEYLHGLGGVGTEGAISNYWWGNRVGFTAEIQQGEANWVIEQRKQWWRRTGYTPGVEVKYGVIGADAILDAKNSDRVIGVTYASTGGKFPAFGKVVIDSTGNGEIAFAAGATPMYINDREIAVQGAGLPPKELGGRYRNTDYAFIDETDIFDVTHAFIYAKEKFPKAFDLSRIIDTRERQRIVGDYVLTVLDQINERTYPDTLVRSRTDFDTHGYTINPYLEIEHPDRKRFYSYSPYRIHLPKGLDGILVSGLGSSCERDAIPLMRMQPDLQNQGYGLGVVAATAIQDGVSLREVDFKKVQKHLVEIGNLPESVLTDTDNYERNRALLPEAVANLPKTETFDGAYIVFWYPEEGKKLVREAFEKSDDLKEKEAYAQVLAVMGDPIGVDLLIEKVRSYPKWDAGWNFRGMGQFGSALSKLDRLILALGRAGDRKAVPVILEKLNQLTHKDDFSHYRACTLALECLGDSSAAPALAAALKKPNVSGYVHSSIELAKKWDQADPKGATAEQSRRDSLLEIGLARALYRLGDHENLGRRILQQYAEEDLRGHFRRHAKLVLSKP